MALSIPNFAGRWARDASRCKGVAAALMKRGSDAAAAETSASQPYIQNWEKEEGGAWRVTQFKVDGVTPRRVLVYKLGDWEEAFEGNSTLFGKEKGIRKAHTSYGEEPRADVPPKVAHITMSSTPLGKEEARRYLCGETMILRRTFWSVGEEEQGTVSEEVFVRD